LNPPKFRLHEPAFRTQYAELKERVLAEGTLLPGTPGSLKLRDKSGYQHWYRCYYASPGKPKEQHVGAVHDQDALEAMQHKIEFAGWVERQVRSLRQLGFQVADKETSRVLVELHNQGLFAGGMVLVGTLAYMAWLNELGIISVSARTQDVDLARDKTLKLAAPLSFPETLRNTGLPFVAVPALDPRQPSTSMKLPGAQSLRIDLLTSGRPIGAAIEIHELAWSAQAVPHFDYLLAGPVQAAAMAGGHCIPVRLPAIGRFVWHKLYSSMARTGFPEKSAKDQQQALLIASVLAEQEPDELTQGWQEAHREIREKARERLAFADKQNLLTAGLREFLHESEIL
jgi:hypothetical protein